MGDFSQQYVIIYDYFKSQAMEKQKPSSKLDLARLLGVSQGQMQNWEKGKYPNAAACLAIHKKLGFEFEWLITGQGPIRKKGAENFQKPPAPHINQKLLEDIITALEKMLSTIEHELSPKKKAVVISQLYEKIVELEERPVGSAQIMRMVMSALAHVTN